MRQKYAKVLMRVDTGISHLCFSLCNRVPTRKGRIAGAQSKATSEQLRSRGPFRTELDTVAT